MVNRMGYYDDYLEHHGILGQKWGVRRFESANGTLTAAGKKRYTTDGNGNYKKVKKTTSADVETSKKKTSNEEETEEKKKGLSDKQKKALIIGAAAVGTAVAAYGGYKLYQLNKQATEGLSNKYEGLAKKAYFDKNELKSTADKFFFDANIIKNTKDMNKSGYQGMYDLAKGSSEYFNNQSRMMGEVAKGLRNKAQNKDFSVKEKVNYLKDQKSGSKVDVKKELDRAINSYNTSKATNKLASEASSLARSVTAEGPKSFSKPAQNSSAAKQTMTNQKLAATITSFNAGKKAVSNATKIHGQTKFSQASKANDDYVSQMLKKNKTLSSYSMDDLKKLDLY